MKCLKTLPYQLEGTVSVITPPDRDTFYSFEPVDITGLVVEIEVRGRPSVVVDWHYLSVRPQYKDNRHTGLQSFDITYSTMIGKLPLTITEQEYATLEVLEHPDYVFPYGSYFYRGNVVVKGIFEHFGEEIIPEDELEYSIADGTRLDSTTTELTITASNGVSVSIPITVEDNITGLLITPPTKTEYEWGDVIDYTGLVVEAVYNDGEYTREIPVGDYDITPPEGSEVTERDRLYVTISYKGLSETLEFPVTPFLHGLVIVTPPTKTVYTINEEIDYTGLVVKLKYNGGDYYEDVDSVTTTPPVLHRNMINLTTREFNYIVTGVKGEETYTVVGTMLWDGINEEVINFRDWCPWEYEEGRVPWVEQGVIVYGWEDDDGNRITFPYRTNVTSFNKHNWESMGMHPLTCNPWEIPDGEAYLWVHNPSQARPITDQWSYKETLQFVGSDAKTWDTSYYPPGEIDNLQYIKDLYLPYCDDFQGDLLRKGTMYNGMRCSLTVNKFTPAKEQKLTLKDCDLIINDTFQFQDWGVRTTRWTETGLQIIEVDYYSTLQDGIHFQSYESNHWTFMKYDYRYGTYLWYISHTWADGVKKTQETYTGRDEEPTYETARLSHILQPTTKLPASVTVTLNNPDVILNLENKLASSFPFVQQLIIPEEMEGYYHDRYGEQLEVQRADGARRYLPFTAQEVDRWIPSSWEPYYPD